MLTKLEKEYAMQVIEKQEMKFSFRKLSSYYKQGKNKKELFLVIEKNTFEITKEKDQWIITNETTHMKNTSLKKLVKKLIESV